MLGILRSLIERLAATARCGGKRVTAPPATDDLALEASHIRTEAGVTIHVDLQDKRGRDLVRAGGSMSPPALAMWKALLRRDRWTHVIDIGANYGEMLAHGGLPTDARIIAVEPNPHIRGYLERTLAEAGISAQVVDAAVSDTAGLADLVVDTHWSGTTHLASAGEKNLPEHFKRISVRATTLPELLRGLGGASAVRAAIKIDIEGFEVAVLKDAIGSLRQLGGFAALVEVQHLPPPDLAWLTNHFAVEAFNTRTRRLEAAIPATPERLATLLSGQAHHPYDVVLGPKTA